MSGKHLCCYASCQSQASLDVFESEIWGRESHPVRFTRGINKFYTHGEKIKHEHGQLFHTNIKKSGYLSQFSPPLTLTDFPRESD